MQITTLCQLIYLVFGSMFVLMYITLVNITYFKIKLWKLRR
jgi:hypothetical protein